MRYLRWIGLMSSLLIVGTLGELMAPLPSEAAPPSTAPTVSLKMDSGPTIQLTTTLSTCLAGDISAGYNYCYAVATGQTVGTAPKQFTVMANGTPRVRVADKNGQDKTSLTGVKFVPVGSWPNTEEHSLTLTVSVTLDATTDPTGSNPNATINATNAGIYKVALRSGGEYNANSGSDAVGNSVVLTGKITSSSINTNKNILSTTGTKNLTPLSFTITGPAATADINWAGLSNTDMGQVDPSYPGFDCKRNYGANQNAAACRPTITQTLVATIKGRDTLKVLSGPLDMFCVKCDETFSAEQTKQIKFLTGVVKGLKFIAPHIHKPALREKINELIIQLEAILVTTTTPPSDPDCPGAQVLTFNKAIEEGVDGLAIASDSSSPGIPAPPRYYAVISDPGVDWYTAKSRAADLGEGWHLATITSAAEQAIINGLLPDPTSFPAHPAPAQQYWIGGEQQNCEDEPGCYWQWIKEEGTFWNNGPIEGMYQNWGNEINGPGVGLQPDNLGGQHHLSLDHRYGWGWDDNDQFLSGIILGYVAEGPNLLPPPCVECD